MRLADVDGRTKMIIRGKVSDYIPNPTFNVVAEPGSAAEYFSGRNTEGKSYREIVRPMRAIPEFTDRDARLALMDRMHIQSIVNFPTLASLIEVNFMDDPIGTQVLVHAFNQWLLRRVGLRPRRSHLHHAGDQPRGHRGRGRRAGVGARAGREDRARPARARSPASGGPRSPFLPDSDPFWARVQEAGIPVMMHASDSGYHEVRQRVERRRP